MVRAVKHAFFSRSFSPISALQILTQSVSFHIILKESKDFFLRLRLSFKEFNDRTKESRDFLKEFAQLIEEFNNFLKESENFFRELEDFIKELRSLLWESSFRTPTINFSTFHLKEFFPFNQPKISFRLNSFASPVRAASSISRQPSVARVPSSAVTAVSVPFLMLFTKLSSCS